MDYEDEQEDEKKDENEGEKEDENKEEKEEEEEEKERRVFILSVPVHVPRRYTTDYFVHISPSNCLNRNLSQPEYGVQYSIAQLKKASWHKRTDSM